MPESAQVILTAATLPEGSCFQSEQERLNAYSENLMGALPGNYTPSNSGSNTPSVDDRDKPWHRLNPDGSPDGTYHFFDGAWRRRAPLPGPGTIMMWTGSAASVPTLDGGTAGTATINSGPFWEVATEFDARFPVGPGTFPSGATVAALGTGGEEKHTLVTAELPNVLGTMRGNFTGIIVKDPTGGTGSLDASGDSEVESFDTAVKGGDDTPHNNLPPYVGTWFIRRTIRIYVNAS